MKIYLMRHSLAQPLTETAMLDDESRQLTPDGEARAHLMGRALKRLGIKPQTIWCSPLIRAQQTARIVALELGEPFLVDTKPVLKPGMSASAFLDFLRDNPCPTVLAVGHQPDIGDIVSFLLWDLVGARFPVQEGCVIGLDAPNVASREKIRMELLLSPEMAERIAR
jgi:phosphohistidine phosphatase